MLANPLQVLLTRLETTRPIIAKPELGDQLTVLVSAGLLREAYPVSAVACPECGGSYFGDIQRVREEATGVWRCYIACPECGASEVNREALLRWQIDPDAMAGQLAEQLCQAKSAPSGAKIQNASFQANSIKN